LDDIRPGGLGVYIIREIMDEVRYEKREGGGMRLTLTKRKPADGASQPAVTPNVEVSPPHVTAKKKAHHEQRRGH
jgi:hypothetical protein